MRFIIPIWFLFFCGGSLAQPISPEPIDAWFQDAPTTKITIAPFKERRRALIVANSSYLSISRLDNPLNDAKELQSVLERLHFDVDVELNLTGGGLNKAVRGFTRAIKDADVALFFFAGHGFQYKGQNFLLGIDATLENEASLISSAVSGDTLVNAIENAPGSDRINLFFLDACRTSYLASGSVRLKASGLGLAKMHQGLPDTLIAYSAQPGTAAFDGIGRNSPFVQSLVKRIETPDLEISLLLKLVGGDVSLVTFKKQRPQQLTGMNRLFYFKPVKQHTSPQATIEGGVQVAEFGAWKILCKATPLGERGMCAAFQRAAALDKADVKLTINYVPFPNGRKVMRVFAPSGVLLPPGISLKIDGTDIGHAPFVRCNKDSCYIQVELTGEISRRMEKGRRALFGVFQDERTRLNVPINLDELRGAVGALNKL